MDIEGLPNYLRPRYRIFLSLDIVGSTTLKQTVGSDSKKQHVFDQRHGWDRNWLKRIAEFYGGFSEIFRSEWANFVKFLSPEMASFAGKPPELWKTNGDEILYVKEISHRDEIHGLICTWINAVSEFERKFGNAVSIKSTCFGAGFPIHNSELILDEKSSLDHIAYPEDQHLQNFHMLDSFYDGKLVDKSVLRDFIGPSVDCGFRLTSLADSRKMPLSLDVVWLLTDKVPRKALVIDGLTKIPPMRYSGRKFLRGIHGGQPYPFFWLDVGQSSPLAIAEDKLHERSTSSISAADTVDFCSEYFKNHQSLVFQPFIFEEDGEPIPKEYLSKLGWYKDQISREKQVYENGQTMAPSSEEIGSVEMDVKFWDDLVELLKKSK